MVTYSIEFGPKWMVYVMEQMLQWGVKNNPNRVVISVYLVREEILHLHGPNMYHPWKV